MKARLTIYDQATLRCFARGDILNTGDIVTGIDRKHSALVVRPATRFWRAWMWLVTAPRRGWWHLRCRCFDAWDALTGGGA